MRGKTIDILHQAMQQGCAVGAFNTSNLEITQGIVRALHKLGKSSIIQVTTNSLDYVGDKVLGDLINAVIENESNSTPIGFHLDHGHSLDDIVRAIDIGVDSVMIDASRLNFKENVHLTKRVVSYAHERGVTVQAELGKVPYLGQEDTEVNWDDIMTQPEEAKHLVDQTGIDALAVGIGNAHGFFRERPVPDWERLQQIRKLIPATPLILHGASDWGEEKIKRAVKEGICCFNIDTDLRVAFSTVICRFSSNRCDVSDPRKMLATARDAVQKRVEEKVGFFSQIRRTPTS